MLTTGRNYITCKVEPQICASLAEREVAAALNTFFAFMTNRLDDLSGLSTQLATVLFQSIRSMGGEGGTDVRQSSERLCRWIRFMRLQDKRECARATDAHSLMSTVTHSLQFISPLTSHMRTSTIWSSCRLLNTKTHIRTSSGTAGTRPNITKSGRNIV